MRRPVKAIFCLVLLSSTALAACGSSSSPPKPVTVQFRSPAVVGTTLPARYTCDGKNISPPLEWGAVPATTRELALFVLGLTPNPRTGRYSFSVEWAVAGVNPALHKLEAGRLPPAAHVGQDSDGKRRYSICPKKGKSEAYQFALYAIPDTVAVPPKFIGLHVLGAIADPTSTTVSKAGGAFVANYKRR
jgi:phosphatidylethanolamine-binding protein (PEBP) family uncharacterized protein